MELDRGSSKWESVGTLRWHLPPVGQLQLREAQGSKPLPSLLPPAPNCNQALSPACPAAGPHSPGQSCSYQANSSSGCGDQWEPQSGQLSPPRVNAPHSTPGPASALLPNSQQSVRVGASFHTLSQGLLLSPTSLRHRSSGSAHKTPFPLQTGEEGCSIPYVFVPLRETRSVL